MGPVDSSRIIDGGWLLIGTTPATTQGGFQGAATPEEEPRSGVRSGVLARVALQGEPLRVVAGVVPRSTFYFFHDVSYPTGIHE